MKNLLLTLPLVLSLLLAGCQSNPSTPVEDLPATGGTKAPTETDSATATVTFTATSVIPGEFDVTVIPADPVKPERDALEEIVAALLAMNDQVSFRVEQVVNSPDGTAIQYVDVLLPDKYHMTTTDMEMIIIEDSAWVKVEGEWMATPGDGETIVKSFTFIADEEEANRFRDAATSAGYHGEDTLNGERVYVYTFGLFENGRSSDQRLWVAVSDGLPRRMEITLLGEDGQALITNSFYDYNVELIIGPP